MHHWLAGLLAYLSRIPAIATSDVNCRVHRILLLKEISWLISSRAGCLYDRPCRRTSLHPMLPFSFRLMYFIRPTYSLRRSFWIPSCWRIPHTTTWGIGCMWSVAMLLLAYILALVHTVSFCRTCSSIWVALRHWVYYSKRLLFFFRINPWVLNHISFEFFWFQLWRQVRLSHVLLLHHLFLDIF